MDIRRYNEDDFLMFVSQLIDSGRIEGVELGITKYFIDHGYDALSTKQKYLFNKSIANNCISKCKRCAIDVPWREMFEAIDNGGYCNYCQYMMEKIEKE